MNSPGNRSSVQLRSANAGGNRGSINMERSGLLQNPASGDDHINNLQSMDLSAFFAPPPTRWEQSENILDYFNILYLDFLDWWDNLDWQVMRDYMVYFLDKFTVSLTVDDVMLLFTLYTLFGNEIEVLTHTESHNQIYENMFTISFTLFCIELIMNTIARTTIISWYPFLWEGYLFSFFWCLDIIAILSLFPDLNWIANPIGLAGYLDNFSGNSSITQAARVVRLVRLVRLVKIYKIQYEKRKRRQEEKELYELASYGIINYDQIENYKQLNDYQGTSKLGIELSESITRKVMVLILIMIIILPIITYTTVDESSDFAMTFLHRFATDPSINDQCRFAALAGVQDNKDESSVPDNFLLRLRMNPTVPGYYYADQHRVKEIAKVYKENITHTYFNTTSNTTVYTSGLFTTINYAETDAMYSILFTIVVAIILVGGAIIFTSDAEKLILKPIERMMNMVEAVAQDPLAPISSSLDSSTALGGNMNKRSSVRTEANALTKMQQKGQQTGEYETKLLETTLEKITGLLRVGFGEAGANIISSNLSTNNRSVTIDPLIAGVRIYAIFGFCDIHHFEEINTKLNKDVLTFVNTIAEIVHSNVHNWGGQCNKNLGNAFVIVWRIGDEESLIAANDASILSRKRSNFRMKSDESMKERVVSPSERRQKWKDNASNHSGDTSSQRQRPHAGTLTSYSGDRSSNQDSQSQANEDDIETASNFTGGSPKKKKAKAHYTVDLRRVPGIDQIADGALIGYLKIIAEINRSMQVLEYRKDPRLNDYYAEKLQKGRKTLTGIREINKTLNAGLGLESSHGHRPSTGSTGSLRGIFGSADSEDTKNENGESVVKRHPPLPKRNSGINNGPPKKKEFFKVRMGFGLHAGWAIEGAVGSIFKVDATYLSPHVNMAARLETSSRQYKVPLLMSHLFHELLSEIPSKKCRKLDVVTVKGSEVPIGIYTYDCFQDQVFNESTPSSVPLTAHALHRLMSVAGISMNGSSKRITRTRSRGNSRPQSPDGAKQRPSTPDLSRVRSSSDMNAGNGQKPRNSTTDTSSPRAGMPRVRSSSDMNASNGQKPRNSTADSPRGGGRSPTSIPRNATPELSLRKQALTSGARNPSPANQIRSITPGFSPLPSPTNADYSNRNLPSPPSLTRPVAVKSKSVTIVEEKEFEAEEGGTTRGEYLLLKSQTFSTDSDVELTPIIVPELTNSIATEVHDTRPFAKKNSFSSRSSNTFAALTPTPGVTPAATPALPSPPQREEQTEAQGQRKGLPLPPMGTEHTAKTRLLLSKVHTELVKKNGETSPQRSSTSTRGSVSSSRKSVTPRTNHRTSLNSVGSNGSLPQGQRLPLPPLSTQHSPTARLLLGQVHRELMKIQKEVDRRRSDFNEKEQMKKRKTFRKSVTIAGEEGDEDDDDDDEEDIDYLAIEEYLKSLFPDAEMIIPPYDDYTEIFLKDIDLLQLRCHINERFQEVFSMGLTEYLKGNWLQAKVFLQDANKIMEECMKHFMKTPLYRKTPDENIQQPESVLQVVNFRRLSMRSSIVSMNNGVGGDNNSPVENGINTGTNKRFSIRKSIHHQLLPPNIEIEVNHDLPYGDGPAQTLLNYMKQFNYVAPPDWKGYRPLTSK